MKLQKKFIIGLASSAILLGLALPVTNVQASDSNSDFNVEEAHYQLIDNSFVNDLVNSFSTEAYLDIPSIKDSMSTDIDASKLSDIFNISFSDNSGMLNATAKSDFAKLFQNNGVDIPINDAQISKVMNYPVQVKLFNNRGQFNNQALQALKLQGEPVMEQITVFNPDSGRQIFSKTIKLVPTSNITQVNLASDTYGFVKADANVNFYNSPQSVAIDYKDNNDQYINNDHFQIILGPIYDNSTGTPLSTGFKADKIYKQAINIYLKGDWAQKVQQVNLNNKELPIKTDNNNQRYVSFLRTLNTTTNYDTPLDGIVTIKDAGQKGYVPLYNSQGEIVADNNVLRTGTRWKTDLKCYIPEGEGQAYYRVGKDAYVLVSQVTYEPKLTHHLGVVKVFKQNGAQIYNWDSSQNKFVANPKRILSNSTAWKYDQSMFLGEQYYRISTNEWVPADSITVIK
ncbi:hypothetical protein JG29_11130 [Bombilactobacillus mellis]|uniref:S-layer protein C-terminal domain-containing protein n=1 Tax=Bombilactobacillus mellis TaxID=1218508 RepID=A0A0F4KQM6_9LACO|nr:SLAP domain-containing protein [Bombilactobacillus mellis]KJY48705.1 hypothetical protein JG29_11130 [Bombilactobacillus mellis]